MREVWYPPAIGSPGPMWKTSGLHNPWAAVFHSSEGTKTSDLNVLNGSIESSWHLYNPKWGPMLQHYPLNLITWHARGFNRESIGVENEGFAGEPLRENQIINLQNFSQWLVEEGWIAALTRGGLTQTLWEHNEVGVNQDPPYGTACPSGRIPWDEIIKEEVMTPLILLHLKGAPHGSYWISDWMQKRPAGGQAGLDAFRFMGVPEAALEQEMLDSIEDMVTLDDLAALAIGTTTSPAMTEVSGEFKGKLS